MIQTVKAVTFLQALRSGRTCPSLMICENAFGQSIETVVKLYSGRESSPLSLICELLSSLLAQDLALKVPTPFLVDIEADFYQGISDPAVAAWFRNSSGLNFGTLHLGHGYVTWPQERSIPGSLLQIAAEIFAFDLLIQNPDRRRDKPNLLRRGDEIAIFDHEMAFSFYYALVEEFPWEGKGMGYAKDHVFYRGLKGKIRSWDRLAGALELIDDNRLGCYRDSIPEAWRRNGGNAVARIIAYLGMARDNSGRLFERIAEVLA